MGLAQPAISGGATTRRSFPKSAPSASYERAGRHALTGCQHGHIVDFIFRITTLTLVTPTATERRILRGWCGR
jgi:hypothetical protein